MVAKKTISKVTSSLFGLTLIIDLVVTYNLSPKPNIIFHDPQLSTAIAKVQSSYFGFTLILRPRGLIVGAPRAQSTLESQRKINETGAIYKCPLTSKICAPFVFDSNGNVNFENSEYTYDSEKKDNQWLGGSMDGGPEDTDRLIVCAPRFLANSPNDYFNHGICYWTPDTLGERPSKVTKISPLRLKSNQVKQQNNVRYYYHMLGEQGISAHVTANNEEILIGAPGIHTWKGSIIRYHQKTSTEDPSLSRRDTVGARVRQYSGAQSVSEYVSEVPNPDNWDQPNDSYFGYAVASGFFDSANRGKLLYIATAPQANEQSGEAYIFDISGESITKYHIFRGSQFGEYFGYAVLAEDLNGDGLTDVIISAPQYSATGSFDDGAIYVFTNKGRFDFVLQKIISPVGHQGGRFGTTLARLGDINHDGYNDVAVGVPFAQNGSVCIFLGTVKGLHEKPSQILKPPQQSSSSSYGEQMFGHGLSKGSDIDNNGFNDFAIGAPNAEAVYLYRAYPVVRILATINSLSREIKPEQNNFQIRMCYMITTTSAQSQNQDLAIRISVDPQVKRVKLKQTQSNELNFNATATVQNQCRMLDAEVRFTVEDIFKPIELEMHYDLINSVPNTAVFCDKCAAVDPSEPKVYIEKIIFSTGCATEICIADLKVTSSGLNPTYTLGSSRTITVNYQVTNDGETAYLPQINITSSNRMPFARIPSACNVLDDNVILLCDLNRGQPMAKSSKDSITIVYDVSGISGQSMTLTAEVFSTGKEKNPENNIIRDAIGLQEFTEIEAIGTPFTSHINLEKTFNNAEIINNYDIKSNGPSDIDELEIAFMLPVAYRITGSSATIPIIDMSNITVQAVYDAQMIPVDFFQNTTHLIMNPLEINKRTHSTKMLTTYGENINDLQYEFEKSYESKHEFTSEGSVSVAGVRHRRRRDVQQLTASKDQYARISQTKSYDLLSDELKGRLPINRTIVFNCNDREMTLCVRAVMRVYNFKPEKSITVRLKYNVDLKEVNQILIEPWEFFVIITTVDVRKIGDIDGKSIHVSRKIQYNVISKHQLYGTPLWVWILAILGGLLALAAITYGLRRAGFFRRQTKEEMDKLVNQNKDSGGEDETETENLTNEH